MAAPLRVGQGLLVAALGVGGDRRQHLGELGIPPSRYREDELQRPAAGQPDRGEPIEIVHRQQPPIGHHHQALDVPIAGQHRVQRRQQRGGLSRVALEHLVMDRHAVGGLHDPEHELAGDGALLGQAELADLAILSAQRLGADGGQVIEHHRQRLIDQRPQQMGDGLVDRTLVVHQRVQAAQQLLMSQLARLHPRHAHRLQPAQHAQLGIRIAQPVEHHHADRLLHGRGVAGATKHPVQRIEAQFAPKLIECPHIAQRPRRAGVRSRSDSSAPCAICGVTLRGTRSR
jgi:hypothetical protein